MSSIERIYKRTNTMYLGFSSGRGGNQRRNETKTNGLKKKTDLKENGFKRKLSSYKKTD